MSEYLQIFSPRPIYGFLAWLLNLVLGGGVRSWVVASSIIVLITASCLFHYLRFFLGRLGNGDGSSSKGALFGSALWLLSPLSVVTTSWPTYTFTLVAFWFLVLGTMLVFDVRVRRQLLGIPVLAASFLTYEAYLIVFPISLFAIAITEGRVARSHVRCLLLFAGAFLLATGYKEIAKLVGFGLIHKSLNDAWPALFMSNMSRLPSFLDQALSPFTTATYLFAGLFLLCVAPCLWTRARQAIALLVVVVVGYASSALLYALVGYGFTGIGVMSRTMTGPLLFLAIGLSGFFAIATDRIDSAIRCRGSGTVFLYGSALCLLVVLASANFVRSQQWMALWTKELDIVDSFRGAAIERYLAEGPKPLVIIVKTAADPQGHVFGASWELTGAIGYYYPHLSSAIHRKDLTLLPARGEGFETRWNGKRIEQRMSSGILTESIPAARASFLTLRGDGATTLAPFPEGGD